MLRRALGRVLMMALPAFPLAVCSGPLVTALTKPSAVFAATPDAGQGAGLLRSVPEIRKHLFVLHPGSTDVSVIDTSQDNVLGKLRLGLQPSQAEIVLFPHVLAAIDGSAPRLALHDLDSGHEQMLALPFVPDLLTVSLDGRKLAVGNRNSGQAALIALAEPEKTVQSLGVFPGLSDLMFSADGIRLVVASDALWEINSTDIADRKTTPTPTRALARSPDGYTLFGKTRAGDVSLFNGRTLEEIRRIPASAGAMLYPSATGAFLLLIDGPGRKIAMVHGDSLEPGKRFSTQSDGTTAYSGWFDSVILLPSQSRQSLEVIDLWKQSKRPDILLPAAPLPGGVTPDGARLYLPLKDFSGIAVIDLRDHALLKTISLDRAASAAIMGESYGICH